MKFNFLIILICTYIFAKGYNVGGIVFLFDDDGVNINALHNIKKDFSLKNPDRIVIDFDGYSDVTHMKTEISDRSVSLISVDNKDNWYRIVLVLQNEQKYKIKSFRQGIKVYFDTRISTDDIEVETEIEKEIEEEPMTQMQRGEYLFLKKCFLCHGAKGNQRALKKSGRVDALSYYETLDLLRRYKKNEIDHYGKGRTMKNMLINADDEDMKALSLYISNLKKIHSSKTDSDRPSFF